MAIDLVPWFPYVMLGISLASTIVWLIIIFSK
jgi:hypothetical protein